MPVELDEFRVLLDDLHEESEPVVLSRLYALSDLSRERLTAFCLSWDSYSVNRRRDLIKSLAEFAESNFEVSFDALFLHALGDADDVVRATAVDGLWENESPRLMGALVAMLRADPSPLVRAAAASGLGRFVLAGELEQLEASVSARIMTELLTVMRMAKESIQVRRRALESAAYACTPDVLDAIEVGYYDEDESMRLSAVVAMGRSCDKRWLPLLLKELGSRSAAMRYEAALASGELGLAPAVPLLGHLVEDADRQVASAAIWALGQIGGSQSKEVLLDAYDTVDEDLQAAVDEALAEHALIESDVDLILYELDPDMDPDPYDDGADFPYTGDWDADDDF